MPTHSHVRFGAFSFDPSSGELHRGGRRVPLQRQPARLLDLLLSRPGEVVTREEIRLTLWNDGTHVDFERSLNFCVAKLRAALDDDAAAPRFVETVPTRGYRWVGVREVRGVREAREVRWVPVMIGALVAAAILGGLAWQRYGSPAAPKIVVVPFHNETGAADLDRVAKGVSDAAVAQLALPERLARLQVIGNASNLRFSFRPPDMKATGESLGAQYLLLGQLKKDDKRMRIVAHLIRVSDQTHLWAKTYDTDTLDLAQQSAIAEQIAAAVDSQLGAKS